MDEFIVKLKAVCTQTVRVQANDEDDAREKADEGKGKIITDFEWYEAYKTEDWEITNKTS